MVTTGNKTIYQRYSNDVYNQEKNVVEKGGICAQKTSLAPPLFIIVPAKASEVSGHVLRGIDFASWYDCYIEIWKSSDIVVFFVFQIIANNGKKLSNAVKSPSSQLVFIVMTEKHQQ